MNTIGSLNVKPGASSLLKPFMLGVAMLIAGNIGSTAVDNRCDKNPVIIIPEDNRPIYDEYLQKSIKQDYQMPTVPGIEDQYMPNIPTIIG